MMSEKDANFELFKKSHEGQLATLGLPEKLVRILYEKLSEEILDAGKHFRILDNENTKCFESIPVQDLVSESNVFLIDHACTFTHESLYPMLQDNKPLMKRLINITKYLDKMDIPEAEDKSKPKTVESEETKVVDLDYLELKDLNDIHIPSSTEELNLWGNNIESLDQLIQSIEHCKNLKAIWLNDNPVEAKCINLDEVLQQVLPSIEIVNSRFAKNAGVWATLFCCREQKISNIEDVCYLDLSKRGIFFYDISTFDKMANLRSFDLSEHKYLLDPYNKDKFQIIVTKLHRVERLTVDSDFEEWLWKTKAEGKLWNYLPNIKYVNGLNIRCEDSPDLITESLIQDILSKIWMLANCYSVYNREASKFEHRWFIMDEFGSSFLHSDLPNIILQPFLYTTQKGEVIPYSIMWPIKDIPKNTLLYRNFLPNIDETKMRSARLSVWFDTPKDYFLNTNATRKVILSDIGGFIGSVMEEHKHLQDTLPRLPSLNAKLKIFTDNPQVAKYLKLDAIEFVETLEEADVLWVLEDIYASLCKQYTPKESQMINQFPYESCLVYKDHLCKTIRNGFGRWEYSQETYVLDEELNAFIGEFTEGNKMKQDNNLWLIKPTNLARSLDTFVTNSLDMIIRSMETGPKIVQKYIEKPLLIKGRKFDLRFIVGVKSIKPLEAFIYQTFWVRVANNEYDLDIRSLFSYATHFTVMNYTGGYQYEPTDLQFIEQLLSELNMREETKGINWSHIRHNIETAIKQVLIAAQIKHPKMQNDQARSIYGVDVMLEEDLKPKILEFTYSPDCQRACETNPNFFNQIFNALFYDKYEQIAPL